MFRGVIVSDEEYEAFKAIEEEAAAKAADESIDEPEAEAPAPEPEAELTPAQKRARTIAARKAAEAEGLAGVPRPDAEDAKHDAGPVKQSNADDTDEGEHEPGIRATDDGDKDLEPGEPGDDGADAEVREEVDEQPALSNEDAIAAAIAGDAE